MAKLNSEWTVPPHGPIVQLDEGLASVAGEIVMPLGRFPRRMTLVTLPGGKLAVWSAIPLREPAMRELEAMGTPAVLIVPGIAHRLDARAWLTRYPDMKVICPAGAREAAEEAVPIDTTEDVLGAKDVRFVTVPGVGGKEAALEVTRGGKLTLVLNDLLANVRHPKGLGAQIMARLFGFGVHHPQMPRPVRSRFVEDQGVLAAALRTWAERPELARIVPSHGEVIERDPAAALERVAAGLG